MTKVYTVGTSTRSLEEFLSLLEKHGIKKIIDVRRFPTSKFEHFKKENLEKLRLGYVHIPELGGYRGDYRKYMETGEFKRGLRKLLRLVRQETCAIVCAELLYFRCHRRFISDALVQRGIEVVHIIDEERVTSHRTQR
jgi:uncharacterized protein (DUF488 family)